MPARKQVKAGDRFGYWTATADGYYEDHIQRVICLCDCGTRRTVSVGNLRQRNTPSCGCARLKSIASACRRPVPVGFRSGRLVVTGSPIYRRGKGTLVPCRCDCGENCLVPQKCLRRRTKTESCGCLQRERSSAAAARDIGKRANLNRLYEGPHGRIPMRSSWEVAVAHRLDAYGLAWSYEPETFFLAGNMRYTPDFRVDLGVLGVLWVEVKGEFFGRSEMKISLFRRDGHALYVVGKDNFKSFTGVTPRMSHQRYPAGAA